jgi:hypothetical protein
MHGEELRVMKRIQCYAIRLTGNYSTSNTATILGVVRDDIPGLHQLHSVA